MAQILYTSLDPSKKRRLIFLTLYKESDKVGRSQEDQINLPEEPEYSGLARKIQKYVNKGIGHKHFISDFRRDSHLLM